MRARAFAAGVRAAWVVGDSIYGADALRTWLQGPHQPSVLAVAQTHPVGSAGRAQPVGVGAALVGAALVPAAAWTPRAAGEGSQGPRRYAWAWREVDAAPAARQGWRAWILIRRRLSQPHERA
jgi:hypothetical protein